MRIDPHRHLGGSIPTDFIWRIIEQNGWRHLAECEQDVIDQMTFRPGEPADFHRFLNKFTILDQIEWTEKLIDQSVASVARELERDRIDYTLMRFSVNKYVGGKLDWHRRQAITFIKDCFDRHAPGRVGLLLGLKYESPRPNQRQCAALLESDGVYDALVGIDLVGDEAFFDSDFYGPLLSSWRVAGKLVSAHVAESQDASNAMAAMLNLGCHDLAHGLKAWDHPDILAVAKERDVSFAMALTSNYLTGVWRDTSWHPIRHLYDDGVSVTFGTDDPVQCSTNYDVEVAVMKGVGFNDAEISAIQADAFRRYGHFIGAPK